jgi:gephyrin
MKPGKPLTFASIPRAKKGPEDQLLVFGLPGNPVSSIVTFNLAALPAIRKLGGWAEPELRRWAPKMLLEMQRPCLSFGTLSSKRLSVPSMPLS